MKIAKQTSKHLPFDRIAKYFAKSN